MADSMLKVENINVYYGNIHAVRTFRLRSTKGRS